MSAVLITALARSRRAAASPIRALEEPSKPAGALDRRGPTRPPRLRRLGGPAAALAPILAAYANPSCASLGAPAVCSGSASPRDASRIIAARSSAGEYRPRGGRLGLGTERGRDRRALARHSRFDRLAAARPPSVDRERGARASLSPSPTSEAPRSGIADSSRCVRQRAGSSTQRRRRDLRA